MHAESVCVCVSVFLQCVHTCALHGYRVSLLQVKHKQSHSLLRLLLRIFLCLLHLCLRGEEVALGFLPACIMNEACPRCSISSSLMAEGSLLGLPMTLGVCICELKCL